MSAAFVVHALSYCLGRGKISLKGAAMRPWLTLQRPETERTYLSHQLRQLRRLLQDPDHKHRSISELMEASGLLACGITAADYRRWCGESPRRTRRN